MHYYIYIDFRACRTWSIAWNVIICRRFGPKSGGIHFRYTFVQQTLKRPNTSMERRTSNEQNLFWHSYITLGIIWEPITIMQYMIRAWWGLTQNIQYTTFVVMSAGRESLRHKMYLYILLKLITAFVEMYMNTHEIRGDLRS